MKFDPSLAAVMEKLLAKCFNFFDIGSINERSSESPADFLGCASKEKWDTRDSVGENIACLCMLENDRLEDFIE